MTEQSLPKNYDFSSTEERLYDWWEEQGYFKPTNDPKDEDHDPSIKPFVISMPPPNITGRLHMGHAITTFTEDLMIRYNRMKGVPTLWVPGTDHASIATQLQVEKHILHTEEITREEMGREEFLRRSWEWREEYGRMIVEQTRRLGASCDWERERFTMDAGLSKAVNEAFVRLYEKGLIYRGPRLINWSPGLKTAVSDLEVEYSEEPGKMYHFKYMLKDSEDFIPVATTRPETILGDTAVAVHPDDERYAEFVGKTALVPILNREIPVIADEYVDREFGTGALKITPGHDPNDYEIGARHKLHTISIMDEEANINEHGGPYEGMERFAAREKMWTDMYNAELVIKEEPHTLNVPRAQRGGEIIEPMISTQWFMKIQPLADPAMEAVHSGQIKIVPERFTKTYFHWLENIQDWCISRQLWWGHRIPVWYGPDGTQFCAHDEAEAQEKAKAHFGDAVELVQDPDALDTWFSSGLWPFSTLGWPDETPDLNYFYPTAVMETGYDILFFWVVRMIMLGLEFTGEIPFDTVYLHGLIRAEDGRKMSKTLDNVVDPLSLMDEYGTDALRFTLLTGSTPGNDMNLSVEKIEANRNFANKIWNAGRLVLSLLERAPKEANEDAEWTLADSWIYARCNQVTGDVSRLIDRYQFGEAGRQIYDFFWNEFADWYLEIAKLQVTEGGARALKTTQVLVRVMDTSLRLLHLYTPFISEEMWGHLKTAAQAGHASLAPTQGWEDALIIAQWPQAEEEQGWEADTIHDFELLREVVRSIRNLRAEKDVKHSQKIGATLVSAEAAEMLEGQAASIAALAGVAPDSLHIKSSIEAKPEGSIALVAGPVEIYLPLAELVDAAEERSRLEKDLAETRSHIQRLEKLLGSDFAKKAPAQVVEKEQAKLLDYKETAQRIQAQLDDLK
ncbi:MAG: valine--tRNA ligase [Chloroflexi bacterium]|nr:MAG: valine--tRNA ligase [Chloroflexota bacterium]MBL1195879.1 valine--tRNA ligase [Chloroflexota bacterium]NOH13171.1 valine--tRNA ligase [Chloroflexota bacterium]